MKKPYIPVKTIEEVLAARYQNVAGRPAQKFAGELEKYGFVDRNIRGITCRSNKINVTLHFQARRQPDGDYGYRYVTK